MSEPRWIFRPVIRLTLEEMSWLLAWDAFENDRPLTDLTWEEIESRIHDVLVDGATFSGPRDVIGHIPSVLRLDLMEYAVHQIQQTERSPDLG